MADKLQVMLELEKRGALPPDKQAILAELRHRGAIPGGSDVDNPQDTYGLKPSTKDLVAQNIPFMAADIAKAPTAGTMPPSEANPSFFGKPQRVGAPEPVLRAPVPEWKQTAMQGVNALPEVGQAVGTAAGIAPALAPGAEPLAAMSIPAGGAAGRVIGKTAQSALAKLLLPESGGTGVATPSELTGAGTQGASGAMLDALLMRGGTTLGASGNRPLEHLEGTFNPDETKMAKLRDYLTQRNLKVPLEDPNAESIIRNVGQQGIDVAHGKGPKQIQRGIKNLSGQVENEIQGEPHLQETTGVKQPIPTKQAMANLAQLRDEYLNSGLLDEAQAVEKQMMNFSILGESTEPMQAHVSKKNIYKTVTGPQWEEFSSPPGAEAKKEFSTGLAHGLEEAPGGENIGPLNEQIGQLIQMRKPVTTAANKIQEMGVLKRGSAHAKQAGASIANKLNISQNAPEAPPTDFSRIGSPTQTLEEMLNVKLAAPNQGVPLLEYNPRGEGTMYGTPNQQKQLPFRGETQYGVPPTQPLQLLGGGRMLPPGATRPALPAPGQNPVTGALEVPPGPGQNTIPLDWPPLKGGEGGIAPPPTGADRDAYLAGLQRMIQGTDLEKLLQMSPTQDRATVLKKFIDQASQ
jgi:hypothetical protein